MQLIVSVKMLLPHETLAALGAHVRSRLDDAVDQRVPVDVCLARERTAALRARVRAHVRALMSSQLFTLCKPSAARHALVQLQQQITTVNQTESVN